MGESAKVMLDRLREEIVNALKEDIKKSVRDGENRFKRTHAIRNLWDALGEDTRTSE